ncbi:MAG TPA: hydrogenase expression protein, partial [Micromonosporaceae bacterium]|nr:hydrogenase expression protein [Micromonosporaceae bacterium]
MSFLARLSLANRGLVALITIAILGFGVAIVPQLRQQMFPDLQFPSVSVIASYPGATPEIVEQQVAIPIEQAVGGIDGVTIVTSASRTGSATVWVNFDYGIDVKAISSDIEQALSRIDGRLPANVDPTVMAGTTDDIPVIMLAASGVDEDELRGRVLPALNEIDGVREATLTGARRKQVTISVNQKENTQAVIAALTANGVSTAGGVITEGGLSYSVAVGGRFTDLDQIRNLYVNPTTQLKDIAGVEASQGDLATITRTNGKSSLGIAVTAIPGANAVEISHAVTDKLPALESATG